MADGEMSSGSYSSVHIYYLLCFFSSVPFTWLPSIVRGAPLPIFFSLGRKKKKEKKTWRTQDARVDTGREYLDYYYYPGKRFVACLVDGRYMVVYCFSSVNPGISCLASLSFFIPRLVPEPPFTPFITIPLLLIISRFPGPAI